MITDIGIIGAGPAGVSAAIYAVRAGLRVSLFENVLCGGQVASSAQIDNYPGIPHTDGPTLAMEMQAQLEANGVSVTAEKIVSVKKSREGFVLTSNSGKHTVRTLIIANGAKRRTLNCPGEKEFVGRGVSYCAVCDGGFFREKKVAVIGGGNTAVEEALHLSALCEKVYLIYRSTLRANTRLANAVKENEKTELLPGYTVDRITGGMSVDGLILRAVDGTAKQLDVNGVFVSIGLSPDNGAFTDLVETDENGYIITDENCRTRTPGVFAAGDTRAKTLRQIVTATGDGAIAATEAEKYLRGIK